MLKFEYGDEPAGLDDNEFGEAWPKVGLLAGRGGCWDDVQILEEDIVLVAAEDQSIGLEEGVA
jgi:hypothetical protein